MNGTVVLVVATVAVVVVFLFMFLLMWQAEHEYHKARRDTAATDARRATELLADRQNRVIELQYRIVEQVLEIGDLRRALDALCGDADLSRAEVAQVLELAGIPAETVQCPEVTR